MEPNESMQGTDFIVTELMRELKTENARKDKQIKRLQHSILGVIAGAMVAVLVTAGMFIWYLNQYDFSGTSTETYTTTQTAEGVYAVVDSCGNTVGQDLNAEQLAKLMEELSNG